MHSLNQQKLSPEVDIFKDSAKVPLYFRNGRSYLNSDYKSQEEETKQFYNIVDQI